MKTRYLILLLLIPFFGCSDKQTETTNSPRIVNIINFVRNTEPRYDDFTDDYLYQTVVHQIEQLNEYQLPATFLLQYDALINPLYQSLLKEQLSSDSEVGAWWEITQPHVEAAGLEWRGRFSWDWHANVGFATGYTPEEREKLVDVYMEMFKSIFGNYPASVGSWFIDAHTLGYMYDKYNIIASCNCKDQIGTDGYTLWGGYWNQAYYPSRCNAYMPAQNEQAQIPVPIFRMLGSDPIYQYDKGIGTPYQGVISLEPVYPDSGGDEDWIRWFFHSVFDDPALNYNYTQAGQENSFGWTAMQKGLSIQMPILDSLRGLNEIRVETLGHSGQWFKEQYPLTPPTSFSALTDVRNEGHKTVWFNSRYYRANLLWENDSFRFRDIHLFDERLASDYIDKAGTSTQCIYTTLPFVDGFLWSTRDDRAGLRFMLLDQNGEIRELKTGTPHITTPDNRLIVEMEAEGISIRIEFGEDRFTVSVDDLPTQTQWFLQLNAAPEKELPFLSYGDREIKARVKDFDYTINIEQGKVQTSPASDCVYRLFPDKNTLIIDCRNGF